MRGVSPVSVYHFPPKVNNYVAYVLFGFFDTQSSFVYIKRTMDVIKQSLIVEQASL